MLKKVKDKFVKEKLINDEVFEVIHKNMMPLNELMAYYRCAIMEVETKFKVLNIRMTLH